MAAESIYSTPAQRRRAPDDIVMFQGHPLDHNWIVQLFNSGAATKKESRSRIVKCRDMYRKTLRVQIAQSWALRHPTIAATAVEVLPERQGLVDNLKASTGAQPPSYSRTALGFLDSDRNAAKACQSYMQEWGDRNVPFDTFNGKAVEDGEYMGVVLPHDIDMDGYPDFYEVLDEDAWKALDEKQQAEYSLDQTDRRGRYARQGQNGLRKPSERWDRNKSGQTKAEYDAAMREADRKRREQGQTTDTPSPWQRDDSASEEAHKDAVRRYLLSLDHDATTVRIVPALDVAPFFRRSKDGRRWELFAAVERRLVYPEDLQHDYGWVGMGDRELVPTGFDEHRTTGQYGQLYLYIAYLVHTDKDRKRRPIIAYTVAGQPTWVSGDAPPTQADSQTVAMIDLYETHGLQGPRWWYSGGMYTDDDNPDYCYRPYLWPFVETILGIENNKTAINCATAANAFTGYWNKPDAKLAELDPEALVDSDNNLVAPEIPAPGEIGTTIGDTFPVVSAQINQDAWRKYQLDMAQLDKATAIDQISGGAGTSARSLVVQSTIGQNARRQIKDGNLYSYLRAGELHLETLSAIYQTYGVKWPIHTTAEKPIGQEIREAVDHLEFDPSWVGPDNNCSLKATYPEERNLAWIDLVERGYQAPKPTRSLKDVAQAYGDDDESQLRLELLEDQLWSMPENLESMAMQVAKSQGNQMMLQVLKLRADKKLTQQGVPGFAAGLPTSSLRGPGEGAPPGGMGGPSIASAQRGGIEAGQMQTGPQMAEGAAQVAVGQGGAAA